MRHTQSTPSVQVPPRTARQGVVPVLLASVTALLTVAASFWDVLWPLAWVALLPLFLALREGSPRRAFLLGWWAETLMYWGGFYWLIGTLVRFGGLPVPVSVLCFALIGLGNGVRLGLFAWWWRWTARAESAWWLRVLLPACGYVALDYLFPRVFPWYLGFLQHPAPLFMQIADVTGVHGMTFILVGCSTVGAAWVPHPAQPGRTPRRLMSLGVAGMLLLQGGYGLWRMRQITAAMQCAPSLRLALIQPNIGIEEKRRGLAPAMQLEAQLALSATTLDRAPDLVIWPESMYPNYVVHNIVGGMGKKPHPVLCGRARSGACMSGAPAPTGRGTQAQAAPRHTLAPPARWSVRRAARSIPRQALGLLTSLLVLTGCPAPVLHPLYPLQSHDVPQVVYVVNHGWHTGIVVKRDDIDDTLWPAHNDFPEATYVEVSWGDQDFFQAPQATLGLALQAAFASRGSVLYLIGFSAPVDTYFPDRDIIALALSPRAFAAMSTFIDRSYQKDAQGRPSRLGRSWHRDSAFYRAQGTYSLTNTCNTWTARALRAAGLPVQDSVWAGNVMDQVRQFGTVQRATGGESLDGIRESTFHRIPTK